MAKKKQPMEEKEPEAAKKEQVDEESEQPNNTYAQYIPEQRTVQIIKLLKEFTDEHHAIKQGDLLQEMKKADKKATTTNAGTLSKAIDEILHGINPLEYNDDTKNDFRICYKNYEDNLLGQKEKIREEKKEPKRKAKLHETLSADELKALQRKAPSITDLQYVHDLSYADLDKIIQAVVFSDVIAPDEKAYLLERLCNVSSKYYQTPFYDRDKKCLKFNRKGIYSRIHGNKNNAQRLSDNLDKIQKAINEGNRIKLTFNGYDVNGNLVPGYSHVVSPYYIVVYHDMYYLICGKTDKKDASHYRIDLMTDIDLALDAQGNPLDAEAISYFRNLPNRYDWDPEKYMSEHIYMAYDKPKKIKLKIPDGYHTVMHDWFGNNYRKCNISCEDGFEIVQVCTSPNMIVHWAMQYAETVEVLDKQVRKKIVEEIKNLNDKYLDVAK